MNDYWERFELLSRRAPNHPCVYNFVFSKLFLIRKKLDLNSIQNGLEIGCGNGSFTIQLKNIISNIVGIDLSSIMLNLCRKNSNLDLIRSSVLKLPFRDNSFDLIFSANVLHHLKNPSRGLKEVSRVTKKYYILIEPNRNNLLMAIFALFNKNEQGLIRLSLKNLKNLLLMYKFQIIDSFSTGFIAPNRLPTFLKRIFRAPDLKKMRFGLYNVILSKKINY